MGYWRWKGTDDEVLQEVIHRVTGIQLERIIDFYYTLENRERLNPALTLKENKVEDKAEIQVIPKLKGGARRWTAEEKKERRQKAKRKRRRKLRRKREEQRAIGPRYRCGWNRKKGQYCRNKIREGYYCNQHLRRSKQYKCKGVTEKQKGCKRWITQGRFCKNHEYQRSSTWKSNHVHTRIRCKGRNRKGKRCSSKTIGKQYCRDHED